ncbi:SlyX family protein [Halomonas denitrificans]|nr:SlyX family protein [Halomonas denitrificans]
MSTTDDRIAQLESKLTFLEHSVDVLSGELEAQQAETRTLLRKLKGLQEQLDSQQRDTGIDDSSDQPPPHY